MNVTTTSGYFVHEPERKTRDGIPYMPCMLMKPDLRLRLHAMQEQPCFHATSNPLLLPGGNADRAYNTLHFVSKVVSQRTGPLETPDNKTGYISRTFPVLDTQPLFIASGPVLWSACNSL